MTSGLGVDKDYTTCQATCAGPSTCPSPSSPLRMAPASRTSCMLSTTLCQKASDERPCNARDREPLALPDQVGAHTSSAEEGKSP